MAALEDKQLSKLAFRTLIAIASHADKRGRCWPSQQRIAVMLGSSRPKVNAAFHELKLRGHIAYLTKHKSGAWHVQITQAGQTEMDLGEGDQDEDNPVPYGGHQPVPYGGHPPVPDRGHQPVPTEGTQTNQGTSIPPTPYARQGEGGTDPRRIGDMIAPAAAPPVSGEPHIHSEGTGTGTFDGQEVRQDQEGENLSTPPFWVGMSPALRKTCEERIAALANPAAFWTYAQAEATRTGRGLEHGRTAAIQKFGLLDNLPKRAEPETGGRKRKRKEYA